MTEQAEKSIQHRSVSFASRLRSRSPMAGMFIRSSDHKQIELIGRSQLDMVCLDAEHAVFDRSDLDRCVLAAYATDLPCLIRVPKLDAASISQALDIGSAGVLVPHIKSAADAETLARVSRYGRNGRGFASSCRSADYGALSRAANIANANEQSCVIAMLEDPEAFENLDSIVSTAGIDGFFVGKADLAVAMGVAADSKELSLQIGSACAAALEHQKALGMVLENSEKVPQWIDKGMSFFLISSDYSLISRGAQQVRQDFLAAVSGR